VSRLRHLCLETQTEPSKAIQPLLVTPEDEPEITVDNLEVAQFVNLLLHNDRIRQAIDTVSSPR